MKSFANPLQSQVSARAATIMELASPLKAHGIEIYKSAVKSIVLSDRNFICPVLKLLDLDEAVLDSTYAMMHMPEDRKEKGDWHRDANSDIEVIWVPVTINNYFRISYVPWTESRFLSKVALVLYRLLPWLPSRHLGKDQTIWQWNGRLIHKGDLNSSGHVALQYQIVIRPSRRGPGPALLDYSLDDVADLMITINQACQNQTVRINQEKFDRYELFFRSFQHITALRGSPVDVVVL